MARKEQETMAQAGESFAKARTARLAREEERRQASTRFLSEYSGPRRVTDELLVERALGDTLGPPRAAQRGHYITQSIADPEGISGSLYTNPATGATRLTARTARGNVELPFASRIAALRFIRHRHGDPLDYDKLINTARTLRQLYGIGEHTGDAFLK